MWESDLAHGLGMDEVVVAPDAGVVVVLPLHVDVKVGEVVALRDGEFLPHLVTFLLTALHTHRLDFSVSLLFVIMYIIYVHQCRKKTPTINAKRQINDNYSYFWI